MILNLDPKESAVRQERVLAMLAERGGKACWDELPDIWTNTLARGARARTTERARAYRMKEHDLIALLKSGRLVRGPKGMVGTSRKLFVTEAQEKALRRLPMLERGVGEKHSECLHYDGCLTRYCSEEPKLYRKIGMQARCPAKCAHLTEVPRHVHHELAAPYSRPFAVSL